MIEINPALAIPESELRFAASRSGGPGGQNVNKVATRVTLSFDVAGSASLAPEQKLRISVALATRMSRGGVLRVVAQLHRTQSANRKAARERFIELLRVVLAEEALRVPTRPSRAAKERRLVEKTLRSRRTAERRPTDWQD
jgi:ribosome-associated protein